MIFDDLDTPFDVYGIELARKEEELAIRFYKFLAKRRPSQQPSEQKYPPELVKNGSTKRGRTRNKVLQISCRDVC